MKFLCVIIFTVFSTFTSSIFCIESKNVNANTEKNYPMESTKIKITVNAKTFTDTLLDNKSAKAFKDLLPLTINMTELNGNEKYHDFINNLPTNSSNPETINNGDLMLYGSKTLVLFYKTFSTNYSYTKLGRITNTAGLEAALGSRNVTVTFELE